MESLIGGMVKSSMKKEDLVYLEVLLSILRSGYERVSVSMRMICPGILNTLLYITRHTLPTLCLQQDNTHVRLHST